MSRDAAPAAYEDSGAARSSSSSSDGCGMSEADWRRLHARVMPNPVSLDSFRAALLAGRLQDEYLAKDLHKIMQEMRDILREHGELREAANFPLSGRKDDLARAAAAAVRVLDARARDCAATNTPPPPPQAATAATPLPLPSLTTAPAALLVQRPRVSAAAAMLRGGRAAAAGDDDNNNGEVNDDGSSSSERRSSGSGMALLPSDVVTTSPEQQQEQQPPSSSLPRSDAASSSRGVVTAARVSPTPPSRRARTPPITDHLDTLLPPSPPDDSPARRDDAATADALSRGDKDNDDGHASDGASGAATTMTSLFVPASSTLSTNSAPFGRRWPPMPLLASSTLSLQRPAAATTTTTTTAASGATSTTATASPTHHHDAPHHSATASPHHTTAAAVHSVAASNELAQLNMHASPFCQILSVIRRIHMRYGSYPLRFDVPVQYAQAVSGRRLRVHLLPLHHPNTPARWPGPREIVVYVNDTPVTTPWRRGWPEREVGVAKTYLSLDITHFLSRGGAAQRLQLDVFNKDYCAPAILAVVQPFTVDEVVDRIVLAHFGDVRVSHIVAQLCGSSSSDHDDTGDCDDTATRHHNGSSSSTDAVRRAAIAQHDARVLAFYKRIMDDDDDNDNNNKSSTGDDDELVEVDNPVIATRCPISRMLIDIPVRGVHCRHLQCVDLRAYVLSGQKACYWNCPLCDRELRVGALDIDTVLWRTLARAREHCPPHLRLTAQPVDAERDGGSDTASATARASASSSSPRQRYVWQASRPGGGNADIVVDDADDDDDDDDNNGNETGTLTSSSSTTAAAQPQRDVVKTEASDATPHNNNDDAHAHADDNELRKRARDDDGGYASASESVHEGSADCPIEL